MTDNIAPVWYGRGVTMTTTSQQPASRSERLTCRTVDHGLRNAREHAVLDAQLLRGPATLRFARYVTSAQLGAHELASIAVRGDYCSEQGIEVVRRFTGGGALYLDPAQLCWSLVLPAGQPGLAGLAGMLALHGQAMVAALARLGVAARFVFPNDVEAAGRKLGSGFAGFHGDWILLQGSLLVETPDAETMLRILRVPTEKLSHEGVLSARDRLTSVAAILGHAPEIGAIRKALEQSFAEAFQLHLEPLETPPVGAVFGGDEPHPMPIAGLSASAMKAFVKTTGGAIYLELETDAEGCVDQALFSGAVQFSPSDLFSRLGAWLRGKRLDDCVESLQRGPLAAADVDLLGFGIDDLERLVGLAVARRSQAARFGLNREQSNTLIVHSPGGEAAEDILRRATVMLVPYCAKLADCKFRFRDGCSECGKCEVGDAYAMARERGMRVVSITNFEHLQATLGGMRTDEVPAYVGMCCESFYLKRHYAFQEAGIPAVLTDISGATCYELREEDLAYAGRFRAEAHLKLDVVERVMHFVPPIPRSGSAEPVSGRKDRKERKGGKGRYAKRTARNGVQRSEPAPAPTSR
jgi:lipoate---protein ligase